MIKQAFLTLENGMVFKGERFGYEADAEGELVFTTAMTGYLETLTDPSYYGQIVMQTFPLIGNYGVIPADFESDKPQLKAYIVRDYCDKPSNFRSEGVLDNYLKESKIPGLCNVDTRALTRIVREHGVMNAKISSNPLSDKEIEQLKLYRIKNAVESVSCVKTEIYNEKQGQKRVVLWDLGAKENILRELQKRNFTVICVPYNTTAEEIVSFKPDGIMLSNGPGDPAENTAVIEQIRKLMEYKIPTFGICLGHQLLALSQGGKTQKLKYGHRGANQPVVDTETKRVFVTSQNHGYAVVSESLPEYAHVRFVNGNDGTCEGVVYDNMPAFSTQYHPEASAGPLDTCYLFDDFVSLINKGGAK